MSEGLAPLDLLGGSFIVFASPMTAIEEVVSVIHTPIAATFGGGWQVGHAIWALFILTALQILATWTMFFWERSKRIPVRGKHLDFLR